MMKPVINKTNKGSKRIHMLKQILDKEEASKQILIDDEAAGNSSSLTAELSNLNEITEDNSLKNLNLEGSVRTVQFGNGLSHAPITATSNLSATINVFSDLITKQIDCAANLLEIDPTQLQAWIDLQIEVPAKTILVLLRSMQNLCLDPLNEEIGFAQYDDGTWQVLITIEGCSKLLNAHPQFNGLVFKQAETLIEGVPEWIECTIYRRDRMMPITVREYFMEVRNEGEIWRKMPRRMLRHRALQQCVRLAVV